MTKPASLLHLDAEQRALAATRLIFDCAASMTVEELRAHARTANRAVVAMRRAMAELELHNTAREAMLREAFNGEVLDYSAAAARFVTRLQQDAAASGVGHVDGVESARRSVAAIDASLSGLCALAQTASTGTRHTAELLEQF